MRDIRAGFAFEDDTAGFEGLEFVPDAFGDVYTIDAVILAEDDAVDNGAVVVVCCRPHFATLKSHFLKECVGTRSVKHFVTIHHRNQILGI